MNTSDPFLLIGYISGPFGLRGQVKLKAITDQPDHLAEEVETVFLSPRSGRRPGTSEPPPDLLSHPYRLREVIQHKPGVLLLSLHGVTTREAAEHLRGSEVFIRESDAAPLEEDEYYLHQLYHLRVETTEGELLGEVREVLETGGNEVLIVARPGQPDVLIPMIRDVVQELDLAGRRMVIRLVEGLL